MLDKITAATLQRSTVGAAGLLSVAWVLTTLPRHPAWAVLGAAFILGLHLWVLGLEFLLLPLWRDGSDRTPAATGAQKLSAWLKEAWAATRVFAWWQPFRSQVLPDDLATPSRSGRPAVVFVHGFLCNRGFWTPWLRVMLRERRPFLAVNLDPAFARIDAYSTQLDAAVEQARAATGRPPLLVCHSMGGLVARAWLASRPAESVAHVVTIGTPHRGTYLAGMGSAPNAHQMQRESAWLLGLERHWTPELAARFTCWYSNCDNVVVPHSTATLPGADNRLLCGAGHVELAFRQDLIRETLRLLDALPA